MCGLLVLHLRDTLVTSHARGTKRVNFFCVFLGGVSSARSLPVLPHGDNIGHANRNAFTDAPMKRYKRTANTVQTSLGVIMGVQTHFEISETNAWLYTPMDAVPRGMSILGYVPRCCRLNQILTVCRQTDFLAFYQEYLPFLFLFALFDCIGRPIVAINLAVLCRSHTVCYAALLPLSWQFCRTKFC